MKKFFAKGLTDVVFIVLINVKMPTIVGILTFMSRINFMLIRVEHEESFIASGPGPYHFLVFLITSSTLELFCISKIFALSHTSLYLFPRTMAPALTLLKNKTQNLG